MVFTSFYLESNIDLDIVFVEVIRIQDKNYNNVGRLSVCNLIWLG